MKSSTKRILSIAFAGVFFVVTLVVYGSFIRPEMTAIDGERSEVASKEQLFTTQKAAVGQVQSLISEFQNNAALQNTVSMVIPDNPDVTDALNQMNAIATNNQVQITSLSVKPNELAVSSQPLVKGLGVLSMDVKATGSYQGLKGFLQSLETNIRLANIDTIQFESPANGPQSSLPVYQTEVTVDIYYQTS